jgi:TrkA-N domain.
MNMLIIGAYGQVARMVEERILNENQFSEINLKLLLRDKGRLKKYEDNPRVTLIQGDTTQPDILKKAMEDVDFVYVAFADDFVSSGATANIIKAMEDGKVSRVLATSSIGLETEEPNEDFSKWNQGILKNILPGLRHSAKLYEDSVLDYTIIRFGWLNDGDEVKYEITVRDEKFAGISDTRKSVVDAILKIIKDPSLYSKDVIGVSDPDTKDVKKLNINFAL